VRVSEEELRKIEERAEGQPVSAYLREAGLGRQPAARIPSANRASCGELSKWGESLDHLLRSAETGRVAGHLEPLLRRLLEEIAKYRRELLGGPP
jgi:hypothetical protein